MTKKSCSDKPAPKLGVANSKIFPLNLAQAAFLRFLFKISSLLLSRLTSLFWTKRPYFGPICQRKVENDRSEILMG